MQRIRSEPGRRPRQEGSGVLQITGEENGPQGRLLDLAAMKPGAFPALKGGVRVGCQNDNDGAAPSDRRGPNKGPRLPRSAHHPITGPGGRPPGKLRKLPIPG